MKQHTRIKIVKTQRNLIDDLLQLVLDGQGSSDLAKGVATAINVNYRVLDERDSK